MHTANRLIPNVVRDDAELQASIERHWQPARRTPWRCFLEDIAERNVEETIEALRCFPRFALNYSVKTNPRDEILAMMRRHGVIAECISDAECAQAIRQGYDSHELTYNGPRVITTRPVHVAFADSVEGFATYASSAGRVAVHGVRIRPTEIQSRFGVLASELFPIADIARSRSEVSQLGVSFFVRSEDYGERAWRDIADEVIDCAVRLESRAGKPVVILDLGGGFSPSEFMERFEADYGHVAQTASARLSRLEQIYLEPGQELVTAAEVVFLRVLEVRSRRNPREVIVDGGQPNLPEVTALSHRIFWKSGDEWVKLSNGSDRILGCICTEDDVVRHDVALPESIGVDDVIAVADAGAYDSSMSFNFAQGRPVPRDS